MQKIYILFLLSFIGLGCEEKHNYPTDLEPKYSDFDNAWEEKNLLGKVKKIEWYKTVFQNSGQGGKSILNLEEKYTDFGALKESAHFDTNGELIQKDKFEYDDKKFLVKNISENKPAKINYILTALNDTVNRTTTRIIIINDSIKQEIKIFYDEKDYVVKQLAIDQNDTTIAFNKYKFNEAGKVISEKQIEEDYEKPIFINEYEYDDESNLIKFSNKTEWTELVTETEWKNGRIFKQTDYTISADLKKHLDQITEYDELFNPINIKIYENAKLSRELKYQYEFDEKGNWIKREVLMKEHFAGSDKFIPIYVETRKIIYWK